ncbi:NB-ARC domain disease resistance protein, partial [Trifolium medium]|nr:NB-ARC domain disease resistance protein [Trifolium medium]
MERLMFLKSINISFLPELKYIYYEEPLLSETFFPSLESLNLSNCNKLRGWWRMSDDDVNDDDDGNSSKIRNLSFPPCLSFLTIIECRMLTRMPTFPNLDNGLRFLDSNMETLEATLNMISSIEFPPLSKLKHLYLGKVDLDMQKLPVNWVKNLTSLEHLGFLKLPDQTFQEIGTWFNEDFNYLPSLRNIHISSCLDLKSLP